MPKAPPKLHQRGPRLPVREARKSATARGYDHRWRKLADGFVQAYPVCVLCLAQGRINRGASVMPRKILAATPMLSARGAQPPGGTEAVDLAATANTPPSSTLGIQGL